MPPENFFPPLPVSGDSPTFNYGAMDRLLKFRAFQQQTVIYVAASDTSEGFRYMAKYKCDGTEDEEQIIAALEEVQTAGGGVIQLLPGTFNLSEQLSGGLYLFPFYSGDQDITIRGSGANVTRLVAPSTRASAIAWFRSTQGNTDNITIADLTLDGNSGVSGYLDTPIQANWSNDQFWTLSGVVVTNMSTFGGAAKVQLNGPYAKVLDCRFINNPHNGLAVGGTEAWVIRCLFDDNGAVDGEEAMLFQSLRGLVAFNRFVTYGGLGINGADSSVITGNVFRADAAVDQLGYAAIDAIASDEMVISNNTIQGAWDNGITLSGTGAITVIGNTIKGGDGDGIVASGATGSVIANNRIISPGAHGIQINAGGDGISVLGNSIMSATLNGIDIQSGATELAVNDNQITSSGDNGIQVSGCTYSHVCNNRIKGSGQYGIYVGDSACDSVSINGNYVDRCSQDTANTYDGIHVASVANMNHNSIINNVVKGSADHRYGVRINGASANNTLVSNNELVFSGSTGAYSDAGTGTDTLGGNRT